MIAIEKEDWDEDNIMEFTKLLEQLEQTWKLAIEDLVIVNMGDNQLRKKLKAGTLVTLDQKTEIIALLREYTDVFFWSFEDMPGLDTNIMVHRIPVIEGYKPIK